MALATRETTINLRAPSTQRALIDQAAHLIGKNRTDFMLEAACEKAQQVLLDRTTFAVEADHLQRFTALLEAPLDNSDAVLRLLSRRAPWEPSGQ